MKSKDELGHEIQQTRRAALLINSRSRKGARLGRHAQILLTERGFTLTAVHVVNDPRTLEQALDLALAGAPALLIVGSGDGTISHVAARLAYQDTVLGVLPFGTTNNFCRGLGIPMDLPGAVDVLVRGRVADIDLGLGNGRYFANVAGIGLSAAVAAQVPSSLKRRFGRLAYTISGIKALISHRPFQAVITADGVSRTVRTHQVIIANGPSHGGTAISGDASIDDRTLTVFWLGGSGRLAFAAALLSFILGGQRPRDMLLAGTVTVTTEPAREIETDGEISGSTPLAVKIAPEALKVIVPAAFRDL